MFQKKDGGKVGPSANTWRQVYEKVCQNYNVGPEIFKNKARVRSVERALKIKPFDRND